MNRTALCIRMLELLSTKRIYKISELAELLETNPRNIIEYKKELEIAGYYIESIPGKYGGYYLDQRNLISPINFSDIQRKVFSRGIDYLLLRSEFLEKKEFEIIASKLYTAINQQNNFNDLVVINRFPLSMPEEEIVERYRIINEAIEKKEILEIEYLSLKNTQKIYKIHPYKLFMYNNTWFTIALNEKHDAISYYKLNRILNYTFTNQYFKIKNDYRPEDYLDEFGMKKNGYWIKLEAIVYNQYASLIKERVYGRNQSVTSIDEKSTHISVEMQNFDSIKAFVLGFGSNIRVISPKNLIDEIILETVRIADNYSET